MSIWGWDMSFRVAICVLACLAVSCTTAVQEEETVTVGSFVKTQFESVPDRRELPLRGEVKAVAKKILGYPYPDSRVSYWRNEERTVWILKVRGKTNLITTGVTVANGQIAASKVLVYRESRGSEVRSTRFLRQFRGAGLRDNLRLNRNIDGITGATISVNAMKKAARLALYLNQEAKE